MAKRFLTTVALSILTACGGGGADEPEPNRVLLFTAPVVPSSWLNIGRGEICSEVAHVPTTATDVVAVADVRIVVDRGELSEPRLYVSGRELEQPATLEWVGDPVTVCVGFDADVVVSEGGLVEVWGVR